MFENYKRNRTVLAEFLKHRKEPVVICPFGEYGLRFKLLLNHLFGVTEAMILDQDISQVNKNVKTMDDLDGMEDINQYVYLLATYTPHLPDICRSLMEKGVDEKNIINGTVEKEWVIEDAILYVLNHFHAKSILDLTDYFVRRNYISRQLYSSLNRRYMDLDLQIYSRMKEEAYPFPVCQTIYNGTDSEERRYDLLLCLLDAVDITSIEALIEQYKNRCGCLVFIGETDSNCLKNQCERIRYSYVDVYVYTSDSF